MNLRNFDFREAVENPVESTKLKLTCLGLDFVNKITLAMWMFTFIGWRRPNFFSHLSERLRISLKIRKKLCKIVCHQYQSKSLKCVDSLKTVMCRTMRVLIKSANLIATSDYGYTVYTLR